MFSGNGRKNSVTLDMFSGYLDVNSLSLTMCPLILTYIRSILKLIFPDNKSTNLKETVFFIVFGCFFVYCFFGGGIFNIRFLTLY